MALSPHQKNEELLFEESYREHADAIFRRCYFKTSNREEALEISAEVFARTWEHLQKGGELTNIKAFLYTICNNAIKDFYKKKRPTHEHEFSEAFVENLFEIPVEADQEVRALWSEIMHCFKQLEAKYRDIMILRYTDGWSVDEIASYVHERANTVSVWLKRSLEKVRTCLGVPLSSSPQL